MEFNNSIEVYYDFIQSNTTVKQFEDFYFTLKKLTNNYLLSDIDNNNENILFAAIQANNFFLIEAILWYARYENSLNELINGFGSILTDMLCSLIQSTFNVELIASYSKVIDLLLKNGLNTLTTLSYQLMLFCPNSVKSVVLSANSTYIENINIIIEFFEQDLTQEANQKILLLKEIKQKLLSHACLCGKIGLNSLLPLLSEDKQKSILSINFCHYNNLNQEHQKIFLQNLKNFEKLKTLNFF